VIGPEGGAWSEGAAGVDVLVMSSSTFSYYKTIYAHNFLLTTSYVHNCFPNDELCTHFFPNHDLCTYFS
jgi:hypothetical protein